MKRTAENPVPEFPRALRSSFKNKKTSKPFFVLYSIYLAERPNEFLSTALSMHKARAILKSDILTNLRNLKFLARQFQNARKMGGF